MLAADVISIMPDDPLPGGLSVKMASFVLSVVAALAISGCAPEDTGMNGTYVAEKASLSLYAILPMKMYLVVNGDDAYLLTQGPGGEKKIPAKARVDGNQLILGDKDDKNPMIFYHRVGSSGILDCHVCQANGMPGVWTKVAR